MGFLSMIGAVSAEEHAKVVNELATAKARNVTLSNNRNDEIARAQKAEDSLKIADNQTNAAIRERDEAKREVATLKPDAQKWRDRSNKSKDYDKNRRPGRGDTAPKAPATKKGAR